MKKDKIIDKIRKCLAMANNAGASATEAETALRMAQKMMQEHDISEMDMAAAEAQASFAKSQSGKKVPVWENYLAASCGKVFACHVLCQGYFDFKASKVKREWQFIGTGANPEIASYGFGCLYRQCKKARAEYLKSSLKHCTTNKTKRADAFCEGWVYAAVHKLPELKPTEAQSQAIAAYLEKHHPDRGELKTIDRTAKGPRNQSDKLNGYLVGEKAQLHKGVGGDPVQHKALEVL